MHKRGRKDKEEKNREQTSGHDDTIEIKVVDNRSSEGRKEKSKSGETSDENIEASGEEHITPDEKEEEEDTVAHDPAVSELKTKADEYLDHLQRLKAEFENYRKRMMREREENWRRARGDLILSLIPYIDDMKRFLDAPNNTDDAGSLIEGIRLIEKGIMDFLSKEGLEEIDAEGKPFDPTYHEAVEIQSVEDKDQDYIVAEVLVRGFMYRDSLLRPARVKVYKFVEPEGGGAGEAGESE